MSCLCFSFTCSRVIIAHVSLQVKTSLPAKPESFMKTWLFLINRVKKINKKSLLVTLISVCSFLPFPSNKPETISYFSLVNLVSECLNSCVPLITVNSRRIFFYSIKVCFVRNCFCSYCAHSKISPLDATVGLCVCVCVCKGDRCCTVVLGKLGGENKRKDTLSVWQNWPHFTIRFGPQP